MDDRIEALKQRLRELDAAVPPGGTPDDAARAEKERLERELVEAVMRSGPVPSGPSPSTPAASTATDTPRASRGLVAGLGVLVVALAVAGYLWKGQPAALTGTPPAAEAGSQEAQIAAMLKQLEDRLKAQPDDPVGWSMLGRSYSVLGRHAEAVEAFGKVIELQPGDAQAYADQADALAMSRGRQLAGEPEKLIGKALELDPKNLKALALAGTIAFDRADYAAAARHWQAALDTGEAQGELARNLQAGVAESQARAGLAPAPGSVASGAQPAAPASPSNAAPAAADAQVAGRVTLSEALRARAAPTDTVFVFARAADGPRVPLAVLRRQVKDLPFDFVLDDSMAMNAATRLSSAGQVVVTARISKSGNAVAQPGDLQGSSPAVAVGTRGLTIEIDEELK